MQSQPAQAAFVPPLLLDAGSPGAYDRRDMGLGCPSRRSLAVSLAGLLAAGTVVLTQGRTAGASVTPPPHLALVDEYCLSCHDADHEKGGLVLEKLLPDDVSRHPE